MGLYDGKWRYYNKPTFGETNNNKYQEQIDITKDIINRYYKKYPEETEQE